VSFLHEVNTPEVILGLNIVLSIIENIFVTKKQFDLILVLDVH